MTSRSLPLLGLLLALAACDAGPDDGADTTPPTVAIQGLADGTTLTGTIEIVTNASDDQALSSVALYVNGEFRAQERSAPWAISWNTYTVENGTYTLTVRALDRAGNEATSAPIAVTIENAPAVAITAPADGTTLAGPVTFEADVVSNLDISLVVFRLNGEEVARAHDEPWAVTWNPQTGENRRENGTYVLDAFSTNSEALDLRYADPIAITLDNESTLQVSNGSLSIFPIVTEVDNDGTLRTLQPGESYMYQLDPDATEVRVEAYWTNAAGETVTRSQTIALRGLFYIAGFFSS